MNSEEYLIGIDIGTTGCKSIAISKKGVIKGFSSVEYGTFYPEEGWSEQNPKDWYEAVKSTLQKVLKTTKIRKENISSICIVGAGHTTVLLNEDNSIIRNAILWTDERSQQQVIDIKKDFGEQITEITYQPVNTTFSLPHLLWIKENEPYSWKKINRIQFPKDYIRYRLIGKLSTDTTDALGSLIFDAEKKEWSDDICDKFGIPKKILPEVFSPTEKVGKVTEKAARELEIPKGIPVIAGSLDAAAENLGSGVIKPGQSLVRLGTAATASVVTKNPHPSEKISTYYHVRPDFWYSITGTQACGTSHKWFANTIFSKERNEKYMEDLYSLINKEAESAPVGSSGLLFHPYLLGERAPYWKSYLKGSFIGITSTHERKHFTRSVMEGIAFSIKDSLRPLKKLENSITEIRLIGGGAKSKIWRNIVCNIIGRKVLVPFPNSGSLGAALLGGIGSGTYDSFKEAASKVPIHEKIEPDKEKKQKYGELFQIYREIPSLLDRIYKSMDKWKNKYQSSN